MYRGLYGLAVPLTVQTGAGEAILGGVTTEKGLKVFAGISLDLEEARLKVVVDLVADQDEKKILLSRCPPNISFLPSGDLYRYKYSSNGL